MEGGGVGGLARCDFIPAVAYLHFAREEGVVSVIGGGSKRVKVEHL